MASKKKLLQAAAGSAGGAGLDVDEVFSTYLYDGNSSTQVIENGIALSNSNDGGSLDFQGAGNWVTLLSSSDFGFGTGDFTIEMFVFIETAYNYGMFMDTRPLGFSSSNDVLIYIGETGQITFSKGNGNIVQSSTGALNAGSWKHLACVRSSGTTTIYVDGTSVGSASDSTNYRTPITGWSIGGSYYSSAYSIDGYLSNVRIVKGTAVYTGNFTAPTAALTDVTNTSVLFAQGDDPFTDNSSNSVTITNGNAVLASEFGPFTGSDGEGGLVWTKNRTNTGGVDHILFDTERGALQKISSNTTAASANDNGTLTSFNSNGFSLGNRSLVNQSGQDFVSWTWRKAPKFFDVIDHTQTGSEPSTVTLNHNLGCDVGMIIAKVYSHTNAWVVWHKDLGSNYAMDFSTGAKSYFGGTGISTSSTQITIPGSWVHAGYDSQNTIIYLFAHNNSDGEFGPDGDADIIKCGSYTGNGSTTGPTVDLGFEPQWLLIKRATATAPWFLVDNMRGLPVGANSNPLFPNSSNAESTSGAAIDVLPTGFQPKAASIFINNSGDTYIYMAIRRGPLAAPESGTDVFQPHIYTGDGSTRKYSLSITPDMVINMSRSTSGDSPALNDRLRGSGKELYTSGTGGESSYPSLGMQFDYTNAIEVQDYRDTNNATYLNLCWKRAPSYFDVCCYTGNSTQGRTVSHNLGVVPEMMWIKSRSNADGWKVYHKDTGATKYLTLNSTSSATTDTWINNTAPTDSVFTLGGSGSGVNYSGLNYVAYLFATVAGVSKVGSYTGTAAAQNIDCGFSSGARFVLIRRTDISDNWEVFDTERGIVAGNDPRLLLDDTSAEYTAKDFVDPYSSGFAVTTELSKASGNYIFYAIA